MNKESKKTLDKLNELYEEKYGNRNLVRMKTVLREYDLYEKTAVKIAKECGSYFQFNKVRYVDLSLFAPYYKAFYAEKMRGKEE